MNRIKNTLAIDADRWVLLQKKMVPIANFMKEIETFQYVESASAAVQVSVILPIFNIAEYLVAFLDCICKQDLRDIEIICVDDNSTDESLQIIEFYALLDARIKIVRHKQNRNAGAARNSGLKIAQGKYLYFADPDDQCERDLLSTAVANAEKYNSDIVFFAADKIERESGKFLGMIDCSNEIKYAPIPFSRKDFPERILCISTPAPWNKLFRHSFIEKEGLQFQELRNANDLYFTNSAFALAERISYCSERPLYHYFFSKNGLQGTKGKNPLCVLEALRKLRKSMEEKGMLQEMYRALQQRGLATVIAYELLRTPPAGEGYVQIYKECHESFITEYGLDHIENLAPEIQKKYSETIQNILFYSHPVDFLNHRLLTASEEKTVKIIKEDKLIYLRDDSYKDLYFQMLNSRSWKYGRMITFFPRKLRGVRCFRTYGLRYTLRKCLIVFKDIFKRVLHR